MGETHFPYKRFGIRIKKLREAAKESLADVSGAVEVDESVIFEIEQGRVQPSEDMVLLLINHFEIHEEEAHQLWHLAGYDDKDENSLIGTNFEDNIRQQPAVMVLPVDARIVYSDMVHVVVNNYGVVLNFMQTGGPDLKPLAISRIGMSKEHAQSVLKVLRETLEMSDKTVNQKRLGDGKKPENNSKKQ